MTTCDFTKNGTPKFIFCWKKGTPKNGTSRTFIYGSYPPPGLDCQTRQTSAKFSPDVCSQKNDVPIFSYHHGHKCWECFENLECFRLAAPPIPPMQCVLWRYPKIGYLRCLLKTKTTILRWGRGEVNILTVFWYWGLKSKGKSIFSQHLMARIVALIISKTCIKTSSFSKFPNKYFLKSTCSVESATLQ